MSDIVERLRRVAKELPQTSGNQAWLRPEDTTAWEAADEIEKLRAENEHLATSNHAYLSGYQEAIAKIEKLRAALRKIADTDPDEGTSWFHDVANAALGEKE
jgi:hypothetical protein